MKTIDFLRKLRLSGDKDKQVFVIYVATHYSGEHVVESACLTLLIQAESQYSVLPNSTSKYLYTCTCMGVVCRDDICIDVHVWVWYAGMISVYMYMYGCGRQG